MGGGLKKTTILYAVKHARHNLVPGVSQLPTKSTTSFPGRALLNRYKLHDTTQGATSKSVF